MSSLELQWIQLFINFDYFTIFCPKMSSEFLSVAYILINFRLDVFMEPNTMNSGQTATLGPYCLQNTHLEHKYPRERRRRK